MVGVRYPPWSKGSKVPWKERTVQEAGQKQFFKLFNEGGNLHTKNSMQNQRNEVVIMSESEKIKIRENAEKDYNLGMKYIDIATKYSVSINTIKSWKQRYKWKRENTQSCRCKKDSMHYVGNTIFLEIRKDLLTQLENNKTFGKHFEDLVKTTWSYGL